MKITKVILCMVLIAFLASCARAITPFEAANGKARCGRSIR